MSQQPADVATSQNIESCRLLHVPPEILDRITWHLKTTELCNLRLTCKSVEEALYFRFTAEFFTRKQFMVSEFSLGALVDISKSRLSGCLRHVHLGIDQIGLDGNHSACNDVEQAYKFQQCLVEQESLWSLGRVPKYLAEAFARLPNLESVVIRDFNSNRRSRDGPYAHWKSYGTETMFNETGVRPAPLNFYGLSSLGNHPAARLFKTAIHALGMAGVSLPTIEVMERKGNLLNDTAFHIQPDLESTTIPVLCGLKRLHLSLEVTLNTPLSKYEKQEYQWFNMIKFLRHLDGLEELRINGKNNTANTEERNSLKTLIGWLATGELRSEVWGPREITPPPANGITSSHSLLRSPVTFPKLEKLSLGMTVLGVDELVLFISKFADTLKHLELWRIQLICEELGVQERTVFKRRATLWVQFLKRLLNENDLNLRHIKLGNLQQKWIVINWRQYLQEIEFKPTATTTDEELENIELGRTLEYTGTDWRHFVTHEMIPRIFTPVFKDEEERSNTSSALSPSEDEDEDEDQDEDEDDDNDADDMDQGEQS